MGIETAHSALSRASRRVRLQDEVFDCLVIGGGITGAGIAREAARRGLSVALVEASDFAAGTSSRSSKLIHGGLRYLAQGEVALVRKIAGERQVVVREAPHLAEPVWMLVASRSHVSHLKFRVAVATYEKLGAVAAADRHTNWGPEELARYEPALDSSRFPHACVYREYTTDDARLVLANLRSATAHGAVVENYLRVERLLLEGGRAVGVEALCGQSREKVVVRARAIVNAAGPWVSGLCQLEDPQASQRLHLSKGIHVVLPRERIPIDRVLVIPAFDGRPIFAVPRAGVVYVGTTDTSYRDVPDLWPAITRRDVEYLLDPISQALRVGPIAANECIATWSGLRPLVGRKGRNPSEISRKDEIWQGPAGIFTIAGGKLTGYRDMATRLVTLAARECALQLAEVPDDEPLPGGDFSGDLAGLASSLARDEQLPSPVAERLVRLYGTEATEVVGRGSSALVPGFPVLAGEVAWAVEQEGAQGLEDFVYRRSRAAVFEPQACDALLVPAAHRMQEQLGWDAAKTEREIESVRRRRRADLDFVEGDEGV